MSEWISQPVLDPLNDLIRLFSGLPRKGPGTEACTLRALRACRPLPPEPAVLDLGCGAGASTLVLAKTLDVPVTAVDACGPFLQELEQRAEEQGLSHLVRPRCLDFGHLEFPPDSFDLLWSEGAIFCLGWEAGLKAWKPLVRSGGFLALTEAVWFTDAPPSAARAAWEQWNPAMGTLAECARMAEALGWEVVETFPLPAQAWWDYYEPLERRCRERGQDPSLQERIAESLREIEVYRECGDAYGYAFFVFRKP
jgi:SAM-dependent methyltransferase